MIRISRSRHLSTLNISETTRDRAIATIERQWKVVCALSNADISNYIDGRLTRFQGHSSFEVEYLKKSLREKVTVEQ